MVEKSKNGDAIMAENPAEDIASLTNKNLLSIMFELRESLRINWGGGSTMALFAGDYVECIREYGNRIRAKRMNPLDAESIERLKINPHDPALPPEIRDALLKNIERFKPLLELPAGRKAIGAGKRILPKKNIRRR